MKLKNRNKTAVPLHAWISTGYREGGIIRTIMMIVVHPAFLVGVVIVTSAMIIFFNLEGWWIRAIALTAIFLAVVAIMLRRRARSKPIISNRKAKRNNNFQNQRRQRGYLSRIDRQLCRRKTVPICFYIWYVHDHDNGEIGSKVKFDGCWQSNCWLGRRLAIPNI